MREQSRTEGRTEGRAEGETTGRIEGIIKTYKDFNVKLDGLKEYLMLKCDIPAELANTYIKQYW